MSSTDGTTEDTRGQGSVDRRNMLSAIRRMYGKITSGPLWQVVGALLLDGVTKEVRNAEVFSGIGFYSRPKQGANFDAIVAYEDGAQNPYIVATRDEATRKRVAQLDQDETATFNTLTIVHHKKDGTIELRLAAGAPQKAILGETYRTAEDNMLTAVSAAVALIASIPGLTAPQIATVTAATSAITAFKAAAATYLTQVVKLQ